jgi:hypothetical protein
VRKFKFPSAYAKISIADGLSQSIDSSSIYASKDRIGKLKEMINLPSLSKRKIGGDQSLGFDSLNISNIGDGVQNGQLSTNRLS